MKVQELLTDESKWTKGWFSRDQHGNPLMHDCSESFSWCLLGAVRKCYQGEKSVPVVQAITTKVGINVSTFNDAPKRTFDDIRELITSLDI